MTRFRRWGLFLGMLLFASILMDLGLTAFVLEDGRFGDRPLPPFSALPHPIQRTWLERQHAELASDRQRQGAGVFDRELGWTNTPFISKDPAIASFSSIGARGSKEYAKEKPTGKTRILTFGDSFTFCAEVTDREAWQHQLEVRAPAFEVLNFGVGGYGTDQALLRFRKLLPEFKADVILMGINVENIARNVNRYRPLYHPRTASAVAKPRFLLDGSELQLLPSPFDSPAALIHAIDDGSVLERIREHEYWFEPDTPLKHSSIARFVLGWQAYTRRQPDVLWASPSGEPYRVTLAILEAFHAEALASGARLAGVVISQRQGDLEGPRFWDPLCAELTARKIPWIDLSETLGPASARGEKLFQGGHLSGRGNELTAIALEAFLHAHL